MTMKRQTIDGGGWFDLDAATRWEEDTRWNGNNHISRATGSQWNHEELYLTKSGSYILHAWSQWQGSGETWERIDVEAAHRWLIAQGEADAVPADVLAREEA